MTHQPVVTDWWAFGLHEASSKSRANAKKSKEAKEAKEESKAKTPGTWASCG